MSLPARHSEKCSRAPARGHREGLSRPSRVGSVPNGHRLKSRLRFLLGGPPDVDPTHLHVFSPDAVRRLLDDFDQVQLQFVAGRFTPLHPRLLANDICFRGRKPLR